MDRFSSICMESVVRLQRLKKSEFPNQVWIENTNLCNAHCVMCPRDKMTRPTGIMDFLLFEKLIREISRYSQVNRIHLHNYGEPLIDPDLPAKIKFAKDYKIKFTYIVTNGSLLNDSLAHTLIQNGLDRIKISFYGTDAPTYNNTMRGLDFEQTLSNTLNFFNVRRKLNKTKPSIVIQYIPMETNNRQIQQFVHLFKSQINPVWNDKLNITQLHNYGRGKEFNIAGEKKFTCEFPWNTMVVLYTGEVVPCCMDFNGDIILGDTNTQSIKDIWNNSSFKDIRKEFMRLDYKNYNICHHCDWVK